MTTGRPPKAPIYTLPHGIEVIGEYAPSESNPRARVRIRPHDFFEGTTIRSGGMDIRKSRVILASKLGRALTPAEHAHHEDEDRSNDTADNIEPLSAAEHNQHHKLGSKHSEETKARIAQSVRNAYAEGRHAPVTIKNRDNIGRIAA